MSLNIEKLISSNINKPIRCEKCGSMKITYKGVGEYMCSECRFIMYDDYGIVRNYIESHPGSTQADVAKATGIPKSKITQFLKEDRIEIAPGSSVFLQCEVCGKDIRSGRYCFDCLKAIQEVSERGERKSHIQGGYSGREKTVASEFRYKK